MLKSVITSIYLLLALTIYGQFDSPKGYDIIDSFFKIYNYKIPDSVFIRFEKRDNNWFVKLTKEPYKQKYDTTYLLYKSENKSYNLIPLEQIRNYRIDYFDSYIEESFFYDLVPSYGYPGWYRDVVKKFDQESQINEFELYALGTAYSKWADALLSYRDEGLYNDRFNIKPDCWKSLNCLTLQQIDTFNLVKSKAVKCFKEITKRNPSFKMRGTSINLRCSNEIMDWYYKLMLYSYEYSLKISPPDSIFNGDLLSISKSWLEECPKNSIFLCFGDEFYSLLYLQKKLHIREDVLIICYGELENNNYLRQVTSSLSKANPVKTLIDIESYPTITILNKINQPFDLSKLTNFLQKEKKSNTELPVINADHLLIHKTGVKQPIKIDLSSYNYIEKKDLVLLSIINNIDNRIICNNHNFGSWGLGIKYLHLNSEKQKNIWIYKP